MNDEIFREKNYYKKKITELVEKIENLAILRRIYQLAEYLYIHKEEKE